MPPGANFRLSADEPFHEMDELDDDRLVHLPLFLAPAPSGHRNLSSTWRNVECFLSSGFGNMAAAVSPAVATQQ